MTDPVNWRSSPILKPFNVFYFSHFRVALDVLDTRQSSEMLRILREGDGDVVFTLSGRIDTEHIAELEALMGAERTEENARRIALDLRDMTLTGQDGIDFLAQCEAAGIALVNCDPYVREWITRQRSGSRFIKGITR